MVAIAPVTEQFPYILRIKAVGKIEDQRKNDFSGNQLFESLWAVSYMLSPGDRTEQQVSSFYFW